MALKSNRAIQPIIGLRTINGANPGNRLNNKGISSMFKVGSLGSGAANRIKSNAMKSVRGFNSRDLFRF